MPGYRYLWSVPALAALLAAGCANPVVDARADAALKDMCQTLAGTPAFSYHAHTTVDRPSATGQLVQLSRDTDILVARPDKIHWRTTADGVDRELWYSGTSLTFFNRTKNLYAALSVPPTIEAMFDFLDAQYSISLPAVDLLLGNNYQSLLANVKSGEYLGLHELDGHPCHHLLFVQDKIDWQIWIDAGPLSLPRQLLIVRKLRPGQPQSTVALSNWNLKAQPKPADFNFQAPADAKAVTITDLLPNTKVKGD